MVDYIGIERIQELVTRLGAARFIEGLAAEIEADFRRWGDFDKSARHATHSDVGVIELMPTSDGRLYSFKYVNGHPKNTAAGSAHSHGFRRAGGRGHRLSAAAVGADFRHRVAHGRHVGARRALAGAAVEPRDGADRQRRAERIPGDRLSRACSASASCACTTPTRAPRRSWSAIWLRCELPELRVVRCASTAEAVRGADIVTTVTADKRNAVILTPEMIQPGHAHQRAGRRLPGQDRAARRHPARGRTRASSSSSNRSRASKARSSSSSRPSGHRVRATCSRARRRGRASPRT